MPYFFDIMSHDGSTTLAATVNLTSLTINPTNITYIRNDVTYTINVSGLVGLASTPNSDVVSHGAHLGATLSTSDLYEWDDGSGTGTAYVIDNYRLLTASDVGKTFGTDLENLVYFDTSITPIFGGPIEYVLFSDASHISISSNRNEFLEYDENPYTQYKFYEYEWLLSNYSFNNLTINSIQSYNNDWLYVKDMPPTPEQQFNTDMNELCNIIKDKASTTGQKTIAQMKSAVDGMVKVITVSTLPESADDGVIAIIEEVE